MSVVEKMIPDIVKNLLDKWPERKYGLVYNINFPDLPADKIKGIRITYQGKGHWVKEFADWDSRELERRFGNSMETFGSDNELPLEEGEKAYLMVGDFIDDEPDGVLADHKLNEEGYITITPNTIDRTDYQELHRLDMIF